MICGNNMKKKNLKYVKSVDENGDPHSYDDKPSIIMPARARIWQKNGKLHRDNNKPAVEWKSGVLEFWLEGKFIRRLEKSEVPFYLWEET